VADDAPPEHVRRNRARWNAEAPNYVASGERAWAREEPTWGIWRVPESQLGVLPKHLAGKAGIELGCGTAYISAWLARRGVEVIGLDASPAQLATARRLQRRHGLEFPLIEADAERVPCRGETFDLAISEYGACLWADPDRWVAEAARILRPGGELIFLVNSVLFALCVPAQEGVAGDRLLRPAFDMRRIEWPGDPGVEFHLSHGDWIDLLRTNGFEIERLIEPQAPPDATPHSYYDQVPPEWAWKWPHEEIWVARRAEVESGLRT
jgi:SAM-dependent methyltransferase